MGFFWNCYMFVIWQTARKYINYIVKKFWTLFAFYQQCGDTNFLSVFTCKVLRHGSQFPAKGFCIVHYHCTSLRWQLIKEAFFIIYCIKKYSYRPLCFSSVESFLHQ